MPACCAVERDLSMSLFVMVEILYIAVATLFALLVYLSWRLSRQRDDDAGWNARCRTEIRATLRAEVCRLQSEIERLSKEDSGT